MKQLKLIDLEVEGASPPSGDLWTRYEWARPTFEVGVVAAIFFGNTAIWLRNHYSYGHLVLDGEQVYPGRGEKSAFSEWRLYDIERAAHALTQNGYIPVSRLATVLSTVVRIAQNYGYIQADEMVTEVVPLVNGWRARRAVEANVRRTVEVADDLDGTLGAETHTFQIDGTRYKIDLTDEHWTDLLTALRPYTQVATIANQKSKATMLTLSDTEYRRRARAWAVESGYPVGSRGRLGDHVLAAYDVAIRRQREEE